MAVGTATLAQDDPGGLRFVYDVGLGVAVIDNEDLTDPGEGQTTRVSGDLTFGLVSQTRTQSIDARVTFDAVFLNEPGTDGEVEFGLPVGSVAYTRSGANSSLSFSASYARDRLDELVLTFLDEDLNPVDLIFDGGELARFRAGATLAFGIEGPLGVTLNAGFDDRDYIGTTDPELFDRRTVSASAALRLRFSDVATGRVSLGVTRYEDDDPDAQVERDTFVLGAGIDYAVSPVLNVSVNASANRIEESNFGVDLETEDAFGFSVSAVRQLPNGSFDGSISRNVATDGTVRNALSVGRDLSLPRGSLSFGVGYSTSDTGEDAVIGDLSWSRDLPDGRLSAALSRGVSDNGEDEETLFTRLSLAYSHEINSISDLRMSLGLGQSEELTTTGAGATTRANVELVYRRDFVADLDWSVGYRARYLEEPGTSSRVSNTVFTRIDRRFSIRP